MYGEPSEWDSALIMSLGLIKEGLSDEERAAMSRDTEETPEVVEPEVVKPEVVEPEVVTDDTQEANEANPLSTENDFNYIPYLIGLGVALLILFFIVVCGCAISILKCKK